ncbi:cytochrome c oxidase subunit 8B, mitochondrial [Brienomyrus brachyistius]|uniref:cytochrome c oxidase subunit 8B, mitochondrial n=1 Tax=Brienomyrus brachyistius TaxID=42636 RepID=UPI0020B2173B|nr:cytochrome c oxidase subunit 8B, mitochondrial [Brienomyrus brachyistius]
MSAFSRSFSFIRPTLRSLITSKASISSKPAKHNLTVAEQTIAMVSLFAAILVPSGWILSNLEEYKKR